MVLDMSEIGFEGWKAMMLVVDIFMTWMTWFEYNEYTIVCIKFMNWILLLSVYQHSD